MFSINIQSIFELEGKEINETSHVKLWSDNICIEFSPNHIEHGGYYRRDDTLINFKVFKDTTKHQLLSFYVKNNTIVIKNFMDIGTSECKYTITDDDMRSLHKCMEKLEQTPEMKRYTQHPTYIIKF